MQMNYAIDAAFAKGAVFYSHDGKEYIDFSGGIGVLNAGHCPPPVVKAIARQSRKLMHTFFNQLTHEPYIRLAEKLIELFPHGEETKVMMVNSGAEAVENAVKIARQATKRNAVICFTGGFHGRTLLGMTLTSKVSYKQHCGPFAPEVYRLPFPDYYHNAVRGQSFEEFVDQEIAKLKKYFSSVVAPNEVAAVIIEPVQGEGGFYVTPYRYMKALREICDEHGIVLILDEVQSGFGRTGRWAAYEHYDIIPDLSTWAKSIGSGIPIACVIGKASVMDKAAPGTLGGTYAGNPVACAAALATIEYMEKININAKGERIGKIIFNFFKKLQRQCKAIGDVRGLGAMVAIELVKNQDPNQPDAELTTKLVRACAERGLFIISAGVYGNVIRVLCPLVITDAQLKKGLNILGEELMRLTASPMPIATPQRQAVQPSA
ncbi:MAG: aspartate aminotransferase family protein [Chloroherpetonaceae bacterium]|nr:aspartate aminotransferase family protein [Chloroherpetonaceae bacterium]